MKNLLALLACMFMPLSMMALNLEEIPAGKRVFKLVTSKAEITSGSCYLIGGKTADSLFIMVPWPDYFNHRHHAVYSKLIDDEYVIYEDADFASSVESEIQPMLLRGRGDADNLHLYLDYNQNFQLWGYGQNVIKSLPTDDSSKELLVKTYSYTNNGWQFSFNAKEDWGGQYNAYIDAEAETTGMFMRMPARDPRYTIYQEMYTYVNAVNVDEYKYFQGVEKPGTSTGVMLFKEICRHRVDSVQLIEAIAPTCLAPGYTPLYYCKDCEHYFNDLSCTIPTTRASHMLPAVGHDWVLDECTRCHKESEWREFLPNNDNKFGYIFVKQVGDKHYAMGINPVEEGLEAIEVSVDADGYLKADISKVALIDAGMYTICGDESAALRIYQDQLQTMYYDTEQGCFYDGLIDNWGNYYNWFMYNCSTDWDEVKQETYQTGAALYGINNVDGKYYDVVLKTKTDGTPYFGIQKQNNSEPIEGGLIWSLQCAHKNVLHTEGANASCMEPSTMESYYCQDCYQYFSDAKCHHQININEYQADEAKGHHYAEGSTVCSNCGEEAGKYVPVTDASHFNAGYYYMMIGHIGDQYYALTRPTPQVYDPWGMYDESTPDEDKRYEYQWNGIKMQATPVTFNADGSITANKNDMLEFALCQNHNAYNPYDITMGSPWLMRTPWGIITDIHEEPVVATYEQYEFENWKYVTYGPEVVYRQYTLAEPTYKFFTWFGNYETKVPDNIKNITIDKNSVLMHRTWAADYENLGSYILVQENGEIYFTSLNNFWNEWNEYQHSTAKLMVPTLYYCKSKPMPHLNTNTAEVTIYADNINAENLEEALEAITEDNNQVVNLDLTQVGYVTVSAADIQNIINNNENISNNSLVEVPASSGITGTNIIIDGQTSVIAISGSDPFVIPERYADDANLLGAASASYERAIKSGVEWGTLCLPYDINSNDNVQLFQLKEVSLDGDEGSLTFEAVKAVTAGTPCVFHTSGDGSITLTNTNVKLHPTNKGGISTKVANWKLMGTYEGKNITSFTTDDEGNSDNTARYYIANNEFWSADDEAIVPPFRAWFENKVATINNAKHLYIIADFDDSTAVLEIDADGNLRQLPVTDIYDLHGHKLSAPQKGRVNIINGKKVTVK